MSHVINALTITAVFKEAKQPIERANTMNMQSDKSLRSDNSLLLDQPVKLINIDKMIDKGNECVKAFTCANFLVRHERSPSAEKASEYTQCDKVFFLCSQSCSKA